ncbi:MAG: glycogen synthase GlgA [Verrucomicrobiales bacterium]|nr:glycogen synthase GlgA [Verrucomicrobiales bacterium]
MKVLLASSELHPHSKTGGLADMVAALAKYLAKAGHQVTVVTPLYRSVAAGAAAEPLEQGLLIPLGGALLAAQVRVLRPQPRLTVCFLDQPELFNRAGIYDEKQELGRVAYPDNFERFTFFSKATVEIARHFIETPQIIHLHDWQTGLVPLMVRHLGWYEGWTPTPRTVFTIHNLGYPGRAAGAKFALTGLPAYYFHPDACEFYGDVNPLKTGIMFADAVTTVSPTYAGEITTREFGAGLDGVLRRRRDVLSGILNGVDYEVWRTDGNPHLPHSYTAAAPMGKAANKAALQRELGLPERAGAPLFGTVSRLEEQKGIDLILGALEDLLGEDIQYVLLGSGDEQLEAAARDVAARFPDKVRFVQARDERLAHRIEAASDFYLMPSRYEPCGLNQMYSLRYGAVPVVRSTGGLHDSVIDARQDPVRANGIKFDEPSVPALAGAMRKALALWAEPEALAHYRRNGMQADFSWKRSVKEYVDLYRGLLR